MEDILFKENTFSHTTKKDVRDRIDMEVGDSKQVEFLPQMKMSRWDNEANFSLRYIPYKKCLYIPSKQDTILTGICSDHRVDFFYIPHKEEDMRGYEFEVTFLEKPVSNVFEFSLRSKNVDFFYQPPLTQEYVPLDGEIVTPTDVFNKEGFCLRHRPENVIGSYAVYHKVKSGDWKIPGGKNYRAGKVAHIYRPKLTDSNGVSIWADLKIYQDKNYATITVDQQFLDHAQYPVVLDPTVGYTTPGASQDGGLGNNGWSIRQSTPENLSVDEIQLYCRANFGTMSVKAFLTSGNTVVTNSPIEITGASSTGSWKVFTYGGTKPSLTNGTTYGIAGASTSAQQAYYDAGQLGFRTSLTYSDLSGISWSANADLKYSNYYSYTSGGGGSTFTPRRMLLGVGF